MSGELRPLARRQHDEVEDGCDETTAYLVLGPSGYDTEGAIEFATRRGAS